MKPLLFITSTAYLSGIILAAEFHVSKTGDDSHQGSVEQPFQTIQHAADVAQPGDVITVHAGTYRERVNPPRGGESDRMRITYQAAPGEQVTLTGAEPATSWERVQGDTWKTTVSNTLFGAFNPYGDLIRGDWFKNKGRQHHTGAVYLDGHWLTEAATLNEVHQAAGASPRWFGEVGKTHTTLWAQFKGLDPNTHRVEINARQTVFYPDKPGRNYITVRGFTLEKAATPWAPPTAEQIGLIGTHWSKGWIIENNLIRYSVCSGVALGKYGDAWDNKSANSAEGYVKTIERALANGWTRENIGSHIVRNNEISHCEQCGIVGSLGGAFSTLTGNRIHDIHVRRLFTGCEMAAIKLHGAIDVEISRNHIDHCNRGIWLDWMAQGTRITANLLHDNGSDQIEWPKHWEANGNGGDQDLFVEVNHGPFLVDNNLFLSAYSINNRSNGGAYVHNLFAGALRLVAADDRQTPFLKAHGTEIAGLADYQCGDDRYYNNLFVRHTDLSGYDTAKLPVSMAGNVFLNGTKPSTKEKNPLILADFNPAVKLSEKPDGFYLSLTLPAEQIAQQLRQPATTELLGRALKPDQPFERADGTPLAVDTDYFGTQRDPDHPFPGPFALTQKTTEMKVWPRDRSNRWEN